MNHLTFLLCFVFIAAPFKIIKTKITEKLKFNLRLILKKKESAELSILERNETNLKQKF